MVLFFDCFVLKDLIEIDCCLMYLFEYFWYKFWRVILKLGFRKVYSRGFVSEFVVMVKSEIEDKMFGIIWICFIIKVVVM